MEAVAVKIACANCSQILDVNDLCPHRNPVGWCCCHEVHPWSPEPEDPEVAAA